MLTKIAKYAAKNALRNTFLSLSSIVVLTLLMFFINILFVAQNVSLRIIGSVNERLTISLYLDEKYDKNSLEVIKLQNNIRQQIPEIEMNYESKDEILEKIRKTDPELVNILERQNPLPETITIEKIPLKKYQELNAIIQGKIFLLGDGLDGEYFSAYDKQFDRIEKLISTLMILQVALYFIIATFIVSMAIIIYSIIGNFIYYYKDEIYITKLVGGNNTFIYGPFSLQGMIYVFIAFLISSILFILVLSNIAYVFGFSGISEIYQGNILLVLFLELIMFLCVGALSGFLSSRRYISKK